MSSLKVHYIQDIEDVEVGYAWKSGWMRMGLLRVLRFARSSGDLNRIHTDPLSVLLYKSHLGRYKCQGNLILSVTKGRFEEILPFEDDMEVASGKEITRYQRPLGIWERFQYEYVLLRKHIKQETLYCVWQVTVVNGEGKKVLSVEWTCSYRPVERTWLGELIHPFTDFWRHGNNMLLGPKDLVRYPGLVAMAVSWILLMFAIGGPSQELAYQCLYGNAAVCYMINQ